MSIDFRPSELKVRCKEEIHYTMSISHRGTRLTVAGNGDNKFALECELLDKLRKKMEEKDESK